MNGTMNGTMNRATNGVVAQPIPESNSSALEALLRKYPVILQLLRFATIGAINTAIDFIILNLVSKSFGIESGLKLGGVNVIGVAAAIIQSYFWNRHWAFAVQGHETPVKNLVQLFLVGALGLGSFLAVVWGAAVSAQPFYFLAILVVFLLVEVLLWFGLGLQKYEPDSQTRSEFLAFVVVSIIGVIINSGLLSLLSQYLIAGGAGLGAGISLGADLIKNIAKFAATLISLAWNFVGYKLIVFKK